MRMTLAAVAATFALAPAAMAAQDQTQSQAQAQSAAAQGQPVSAQARDEDEAANLMVRRIYVAEPATIVLPSVVMARLSALGYRNLRDFDVERGLYEVEATNPDGREVELEVDPITGAILDIDDNWF